MSIHICGACKLEFADEVSYNSHVCPETGFVASSIEHQDARTGGNASVIAAAAQARGAAQE